MERKINSPRVSFAFAFVMLMFGTHEPQQQATLTKLKSQRFPLAFAFAIQQRENPKFWDFHVFSLVGVSVRI